MHLVRDDLDHRTLTQVPHLLELLVDDYAMPLWASMMDPSSTSWGETHQIQIRTVGSR